MDHDVENVSLGTDIEKVNTVKREKSSKILVLLSCTKKLIIDNNYSISSDAFNINMIDFFDRSNRLHRCSNPGKITAEAVGVT